MSSPCLSLLLHLLLLLLFLSHLSAKSWTSSSRRLWSTTSSSSDDAYLDLLHTEVNSNGQCVKAAKQGIVDSIEDGVKSCNSSSSGLTEEQLAWIADLGTKLHSVDLSDPPSPVVRREVRQYSEDEWKNVVEAINKMKETYIGDLSEYGIFVKLHQHDVGPAGTRAGPGSWSWHREYLARFEKAMQSHVRGVSLPYWDVSLDAYLPKFRDSVFWSESLLGVCGSGIYRPFMAAVTVSDVSNGPFANWVLDEPCATSIKEDTTGFYFYPLVSRACNIRYVATFNDAELELVLASYDTFADFSYDMCLLKDHDELHGAVGGNSVFESDKSCAVADPVMWFMHTYLDYVWEMFRQKSQKTDLETDYMGDEDTISCHQFNAPMTPFDELKNSDGLSKIYTKYHYIYEESPTSCETDQDCAKTASSRSVSEYVVAEEDQSAERIQSKYLWCDTPRNRCKSKIQTGASCKYLSDAACYSGLCLSIGNSSAICVDDKLVSDENDATASDGKDSLEEDGAYGNDMEPDDNNDETDDAENKGDDIFDESRDFEDSFSAITSDDDSLSPTSSAYLNYIHEQVEYHGMCVTAAREGLVNDIEDEVMTCDIQSSGLTDIQTAWLASLGAQLRSQDTLSGEPSPVVRKEVRQYSDAEWDDIVRAIKAMQATMVDGNVSEYGIFVRLHQHDVGPAGTRAGPGSWGWHREYLSRFEKAMQSHVPGVSLPYWDVSLDTYLPKFGDSIFWSDSLVGKCGSGIYRSVMSPTTVSEVTDGPFAYWLVDEPCAKSLRAASHSGYYTYPYVGRACNVLPNETKTFNDAEMKLALSYTSFADFSYDLCLLKDHDGLHLAVGVTSEFPADKSCAVADPVMWFMHTYLDYIWEMFRQKSQKTDLETDYMQDTEAVSCHQFDAAMTPFEGLKNSDGLSQIYTKYHYVYEESPTSCESDLDCVSSRTESESYFWCDTPRKRCKAKIKSGANCAYLPDSACYNGICSSSEKVCIDITADDSSEEI